MHEIISYKPSHLPYFVGSLIQKCGWPCITLVYLVQILPAMYRGLAPELCTLVIAHTLVKGMLNLLLVSSDQDKNWFSLSFIISPHAVLS